jgi:hypothetical protein
MTTFVRGRREFQGTSIFPKDRDAGSDFNYDKKILSLTTVLNSNVTVSLSKKS